MPTPATSPAVRSELVGAVKLDLVGPDNDHAFAHELLPDAPSRWYLSGFLVPSEAPADQKPEETAPDILRLRDLHAAMDRAAAGKKKPNNSRAKTPFTAPAQGEIIPGPQTDLFA